MAILSFKVQADYEKVVRLREEIAKLETQLRSVGKNTPDSEIKELERKLSDARGEFTALATEAAKAGNAMDKKFKSDIRSATKEVDALTAQIIEQKTIIKDTESDIRKFGEAYKKALSKGKMGEADSLKQELEAAKDILAERKHQLFDLTQEQAKSRLSVKELKDSYAEFKEEAGETTKANEGFQLSLGKVAGLIGGAAALKQLVSQIVAVRGQFQDMETQIETLVGKDTTAKIMPQIKEMAKVSPLTMTDIVGAEKMMLSFNIEAEKSIDYLKALSDVSMGNSQKFNSLTLAFSQMSSAGRLMGQDLLQMINAGFNPLQIISEKTGKSIAQLKEEMSKGAISAEMVQQAFLDATSAGGKFYNMSENASKTINGQISMMQDAMDAVFNEIGTKTEGVIIKSIQTVTSLIQNYETVGKVLVGLVATYGTYRTAVFIATAATEGQTIAELALTKVRVIATKAQEALNKAMLSNPYVAAAVAVAGLVTAMWTLNDSTAMAERRQRAYNEEQENASRKQKEHADAVQGLIDKVRDETQAEGERILAMDALKEAYPSIFAQYDVEKLKLADILELKKLINEEDAKRQKAERVASIADIDKRVGELNEAKRYAGQSASAIQSQIDDLLFKREKLVEEQQRSLVADFNSSLSDKSLEELRAYLKQIETGAFKLNGEAITTSTRDTLKKSVEEAIEKMSDASVKMYSDEYSAAEKEWNDAKKALDAIEKDKDKYTKAQYDAAVARKETAAKNFKKLGGDTTGKGAKAETDAVTKYNEQLAQQERIQQAQNRSDKERARTAKDMEFMVEQARISAMKEGAEKKRAQRELDNKKELEDLERQKQEYIEKVVAQEKAIFDAQEEQKAKNDKNYKKQSFDSVAAAAKVDTKAYDDAYEYTAQKQKNQQDEVLADLLERYKAYEDRKQELTISYLNDTDELNSMYEETGDERYQRSLDERHKAYVKALNALEKEMGSSDYKLIFGDPSKMTGATIEKALVAAREALAGLDKEADPELYQALVEAIDRMESARDMNPFEGWDTSVMGLIQKLYQIKKIREDITDAESLGNEDAIEKYNSNLESSKKDLRNALIGTGADAFANSLSQAADAMAKVAEISGDVQLAESAEQLGAFSQNLSAAAQGASSGGWIGAIVGGVTDMISQTVQAFSESKVQAAEAAKNMADYRRELELLKYLVRDEDYASIFGVDEMSMTADALEKASIAAADYETMMEELSSNTLTTLYEKHTQSNSIGAAIFGGSWGSLRKVVSNEFEGALEAYRKGYSQLEAMQVKTADYSGWANFWGKKDEYTALKDLAPDLWGADGVFSVENARVFLETNTQLNEEQREQIQNIIDMKDAYDEANAVVEDYLENLYGSWGADLSNAISDAVVSGADAWDVFDDKASEVIKNIGKQMIYNAFFKDIMDSYQDTLKSAAGDPTKMAEVTGQLVNELKNTYDAATNATRQFYDYARDVAGIDVYESEASEQSASSRGYQALSEDTGNELVGRALAQYESNLRMEESMRSAKESIDLMAVNQIQIRDIAAESRAMIADSYLELQQIRENTGAIIKPIKNLSEKIDKWDNKIMGL